MADPVSLIISGVSLLISGTTAWLTLLRKGRVRMTRPTIVCFAREASAEHAEVTPKVFLRALLYTPAKRGLVVENLFLKLQRGEATQTFSIWAYGDKRLVRGSGLFVGAEGVAFMPGQANLRVLTHQFWQRPTLVQASFQFLLLACGSVARRFIAG